MMIHLNSPDVFESIHSHIFQLTEEQNHGNSGKRQAIPGLQERACHRHTGMTPALVLVRSCLSCVLLVVILGIVGSTHYRLSESEGTARQITSCIICTCKIIPVLTTGVYVSGSSYGIAMFSVSGSCKCNAIVIQRSLKIPDTMKTVAILVLLALFAYSQGSPCSQGATECQHAAETATSEGRTFCCHAANARITLTNINGEVTCTCSQV
ncbi:hypothetical protein C0Q70_01228 [Pomacea canaliculata]|uniref:Uncharacterized protein n=1 Tax=Pomacea canaliculata TaxID=400727 RepID=A0A2T7PYW7_POMCA|nr:hypothetical protein C0Q70_01228 [Pomacea canaliculata]